MSRLVVPPNAWIADEQLQGDTRACIDLWRRVHPRTKKPADLRLIAWQLAMLPSSELRHLAAQEALAASKFFPDALELREVCIRLRPQTGERLSGPVTHAEPLLEPWMQARVTRQQAEADAVLRGAGIDPAALTGPQLMRVVADHHVALVEWQRDRLVHRARMATGGTLAEQDRAAAEARAAFHRSVTDGTWLTIDQIEIGVRYLVEQGLAPRKAA